LIFIGLIAINNNNDMKDIVLILGERSNLSKKLFSAMPDSILVSSCEILNNREFISKYKNLKIKIIFNLFYPATKLHKYTDPVGYIESSVVVLSRLLQQIKLYNLNVDKIIYTSSASVYGVNNYCSESDNLMPLSLHSALKISSEKLIEGFCKNYNINYTIARLFNMYGGNDNFSIVSKIIKSIRNNESLSLINKGAAIRDFIHINDVVNYYVQLLDCKESGILNIASGSGISVKIIIEYLELNGYSVNTNNINKKEVGVSIANTQKLQNLLDSGKNTNMFDYISHRLNKHD